MSAATMASSGRSTVTGVRGVCYFRLQRGKKARSYFGASTTLQDGRLLNRRWCLETLGRDEAWRRAVKFRAEYETRLRDAQQTAKTMIEVTSTPPVKTPPTEGQLASRIAIVRFANASEEYLAALTALEALGGDTAPQVITGIRSQIVTVHTAEASRLEALAAKFSNPKI